MLARLQLLLRLVGSSEGYKKYGLVGRHSGSSTAYCLTYGCQEDEFGIGANMLAEVSDYISTSGDIGNFLVFARLNACSDMT